MRCAPERPGKRQESPARLPSAPSTFPGVKRAFYAAVGTLESASLRARASRSPPWHLHKFARLRYTLTGKSLPGRDGRKSLLPWHLQGGRSARKTAEKPFPLSGGSRMPLERKRSLRQARMISVTKAVTISPALE